MFVDVRIAVAASLVISSSLLKFQHGAFASETEENASTASRPNLHKKIANGFQAPLTL